MAAAILVGCVAAVIALASYLLARAEVPEPRGVPCGKTVHLSNGYDAFVECEPDAPLDPRVKTSEPVSGER